MRRICQLARKEIEATDTRVDTIRRCALLGFDAISYRPRHFDLFADDFSVELKSILSEAQAHHLDVTVDLRIDIVHCNAPKHDFVSDSRSRYLDPRKTPSGPLFIPIDFGDWDIGVDAPSRLWIDLLTTRLAQLIRLGVSGFHCVEVARSQLRAWQSLIEGLHRRSLSNYFNLLVDLSPSGYKGENPGFDTAIVPIELLSNPGFPIPARGYSTIVAVPPLRAGHREGALLDGSLKLCAGLGDGIFFPSAEKRPRRGNGANTGPSDDETCLPPINAFLSRQSREAVELGTWHSTDYGQSLTVMTRYFREKKTGQRSVLVSFINNSREDRAVDLAALGNGIGRFLPLHDPFEIGGEPSPMLLRLRAEESKVLKGSESAPIIAPDNNGLHSAEAAVSASRLVIETIEPDVDGCYPVKRTVGESVSVEADAFGEGHDRIAVCLKWRAADEIEWQETAMRSLGNDRWGAEFPLLRLGRYHFTITAWRDKFAIYRDQLLKKHEADVATPLDVQEGRLLIAKLSGAAPRNEAVTTISEIEDRLLRADANNAIAILLDPSTLVLAAQASPRPFFTELGREITVDAESPLAGFASWYQLFPRSQSGDATRHGTFDDVIKRLPKIQEMGFDVVYLPPIHPIGATNRKGRNNSLRAQENDPGSPYAIGSALGGHDAIHPELGDLTAFNRLVAAARGLNMEIALDLAIQASPDHPWLREHPDWFDWRPDGSIRYAENPPKKYEDIVNVDFYAPGARPALWEELRDIVLLWVRRGVRLFRVDNPHTKPFPFWEWLIDDVRRDYPDVIFLSEAFTRPKVMNRLAKIGFSQSYTYFTWRNTKFELTQYMNELVKPPLQNYFRPHFFVNTHDINPDFLQNAPRSAYLIRAALATTLSGLWGMYNGFELCEGRPDEKKKEYADSEKYQLTAWDWNRPGNIIAEITALNKLRRQNPALQSHLGLEFHTAWNENILYFEKSTPSRENVVLVAISLDPHNVQEADIEVPLWKFGLPDHAGVAVEDLMRGRRYDWTGKMQRIRLDPSEMPF
jgi:starch synthase (maltosyl-transferring)